ncbi:hypothetical protein FOXB_05288 [Fusarium oxysporum f. sp. conglutinans Fo5176]|uniref:nitrilase n=1 Tax=Fusarium oxysporum (strain Fo5176) TaxID=660025 RepID=F9FFV9_FUSOF|nr:hypothetical protein FOXB_05288 [Fusarium oxysporum f. sp. conglutinans Fo5176]
MTRTNLRVAITQAEPEWFDLAGTVKKTIDLINEAAKGGARLVAFPEVWITGYPGWICLYIAQAIISPQGELVMLRRKIKPTHVERAIFGDGSGRDLDNVVELDFGTEIGKVKVGTLACWEHTQPLLKYHTYSQGQVVHISMWPPVEPDVGPDGPGPYSISAEGALNLSQAYAIEGGAYVLHCTAVCNEKGIETMKTSDAMLFSQPGGGHSAAVGPDGRRLTLPLGGGDPTVEGIVYADLDLERVVTNRGFLDVVGHYSRPDLLWLGVDKQQKEAIVHRLRE